MTDEKTETAVELDRLVDRCLPMMRGYGLKDEAEARELAARVLKASGLLDNRTQCPHTEKVNGPMAHLPRENENDEAPHRP